MEHGVAPHAGAWIETHEDLESGKGTKVAPHAGAWIETVRGGATTSIPIMSHPMRVRGLKPNTAECS